MRWTQCPRTGACSSRRDWQDDHCQEQVLPHICVHQVHSGQEGKALVAQAPWEDPWTRTLWQKDQQKTNKSSATVAELASTITNVSASVLAISELTAVTTNQTSAEEGGANDNDSKKTMTPHGEETMVTLCLLATRSACLRNKRTDPIGAIPCLHSAQLNSQLTLDNILLTIVLKFIPMVK